jgi:hypothetical protein
MVDGISKASGRDSYLLDLLGWINDRACGFRHVFMCQNS